MRPIIIVLRLNSTVSGASKQLNNRVPAAATIFVTKFLFSFDIILSNTKESEFPAVYKHILGSYKESSLLGLIHLKGFLAIYVLDKKGSSSVELIPGSSY